MANSFRLILTDKESGVTSFTSLAAIKREFKGEKVGHAGTLDKFAEGLMIVLVGGATKLNPIFSSFSKSYIAEIEFGKETDTLDSEGEVIATSTTIPAREELERVLATFLGKQKQVPPLYSAIHVNGRRAYQEARRGNDIEMPEREIEIYSIELLSFQDNRASIKVHVSKGTYIRSLARDIAYRCSSKGYLTALKRITIGPFDLTDCKRDTKTLLDKTGLLSSVYLDTRMRKIIENGTITESSILYDTDSSKPYCYMYFGKELYGVGEKGSKLKTLCTVNGNL